MPFTFSFFGQQEDSVYVNANGTVSFHGPYTETNMASFPLPGADIIAPFWAQEVLLRHYNWPDTVGCVFYKLTPGALHVAWSNIGHTAPGISPLNSFQMVITNGQDPAVPDGNNVSFCYKDMQWGSTPFVPDEMRPATIGANQGDAVHYMQLGRFLETAQGWNGRYITSGLEWLNGRHLAFNTAAADIAPYFSTTECDTVDVMAGATEHYEIIAHRGGPSPPLSVLSFCPEITSYEIAEEEVDGAHLITASFTPTADEVGVHPMYFQAANSITPMAATVRYVNVLAAAGQVEATRPPDVSVFPDPTSGQAWITWSAEPPQEIQLIAGNGRLVQCLQPKGGNVQLQTSRLSTGIFTVRCIYPQAVTTTRLVLSRN